MGLAMQRIALMTLLFLLSGCSINQLTVRASMPLIEGGMVALYRESDLQLAEAAFAPNIELIEGMLVNDPNNQTLREYAAQAYYGYSFGFVEDDDAVRAGKLYRRGMQHGVQALRLAGLKTSVTDSTLQAFTEAVKNLDKNDVPAMFWTASCWAKWIDLNRDNVAALAELPKAVILMEHVLSLDENYFLAGPHVFMGVYHGGRSPMLGGNFSLSDQHFDKARAYNADKLLIADVLQAQYLERQRFDKDKFHSLLIKVRDAADDLYPDQALINAIAKTKAKLLLEKEDQWF